VIGSGLAVYATEPAAPTTIAGSIQRWSTADVSRTAFARMYVTGADGDQSDVELGDEAVHSSLPINTAQRNAIRNTRHERISLVSGPPGTGKTHCVAAAAVDAVSRGQSACELLDRYPTPAHLRFGRTEHRQRVAAALADGTHQQPTRARLEEVELKEISLREEREQLLRDIRSGLKGESQFREGLRRRDSLEVMTAEVPTVVNPSINLDRCTRLLERATSRGGLLHRVRSS
jgi:hypothetical protein